MGNQTFNLYYGSASWPWGYELYVDGSYKASWNPITDGIIEITGATSNVSVYYRWVIPTLPFVTPQTTPPTTPPSTSQVAPSSTTSSTPTSPPTQTKQSDTLIFIAGGIIAAIIIIVAILTIRIRKKHVSFFS